MVGRSTPRLPQSSMQPASQPALRRATGPLPTPLFALDLTAEVSRFPPIVLCVVGCVCDASESRSVPLGAADDSRRVYIAVKVVLRLHLDCERCVSGLPAREGILISFPMVLCPNSPNSSRPCAAYRALSHSGTVRRYRPHFTAGSQSPWFRIGVCAPVCFCGPDNVARGRIEWLSGEPTRTAAAKKTLRRRCTAIRSIRRWRWWRCWRSECRPNEGGAASEKFALGADGFLRRRKTAGGRFLSTPEPPANRRLSAYGLSRCGVGSVGIKLVSILGSLRSGLPLGSSVKLPGTSRSPCSTVVGFDSPAHPHRHPIASSRSTRNMQSLSW